MKYLKLMALFATICLFNINGQAQLKKIATIEKVKTFANGTIVMSKTITDYTETYSITLNNGSSLYDDIVFHLGTKEESIKNLNDLSLALKDGKMIDIYEFSACGQDYKLSYHKVLNSPCFKICYSHSTNSNDYATLPDIAINNMLEYLQNINSKE